MRQTTNPESLSSRELLAELIADASLLAQRQFKLAELEGRRQLKREKSMAEWIGVAGAIGHAALVLFLVAFALALGDALGGRAWLGALVIGGALLLAAALLGGVGWSRRVIEPMRRTRRELNKEILWARQHMTT